MISKKTQEITPFIAMDVLEKAHSMERAGVHIVHLEIGEPDFDTPACIKEAAIRALTAGHTHYTHSLGLVELREAICRHYHNRYGVTVEPDQIVVTSGTSPAMFLLFAALLNPGDKVIISDPHYACYPNFVRFAGGEPVTIPVSEEDGFQYRPEHIQQKIDDRTSAIFINSPSNPTGNVLGHERMQAIAALPPYIISDEIYHGLVYEGEEHSILEYTDRAFVLNGFSKVYAMTGWRLGYVAAPAHLRDVIEAMTMIQQYTFVCAPTPFQKAAIAAMDYDVSDFIEVYRKKRNLLYEGLRDKFELVKPGGALYAFIKAPERAGGASKFVEQAIANNVLIIPGNVFSEKDTHFRISYATSDEKIRQGVEILSSMV